MELKDFFHILRHRKGALFSAWLIFLVLGAAATFSQPLKYEAKSRLLIVQNIAGVDPYTVSKSNQYLGSLFSQVVNSNSFFSLVTSSNNYDIDKGYFSDNYRDQMKIWQKTVTAKSNDSGIVEISIYHPNAYQAKQIALGVNDALINQGFNYQGGDQSIKIKIIDQPLVSDYPVKPNIIFNFIAFSALGIIVGLIYVYFTPNKRRAKLRISYQKTDTPATHATQTLRTAPISHLTPVTHHSHPAEKVIIEEENNQAENNAEFPVHGDIRDLMNRF